MIGKVYLSVIDFYDSKLQAMSKKARPVLIVGGPYENDYIVLPISTITNRANLNPYYDILIPPQDRLTLSLPRECFIRTHKQLPVHGASLLRLKGDMKADIPGLYLDAISKMEEFQRKLITHGI